MPYRLWNANKSRRVTYQGQQEFSVLTAEMAAALPNALAEDTGTRTIRQSDGVATWNTQTPTSVRMTTRAGSLVSASARFADVAGCAVFAATSAAFVTNIETKLVTFDMSALQPVDLVLGYQYSPGLAGVGPAATYVAVTISSIPLTAAQAAAILGTVGYNETPALLEDGVTVVLGEADARNVMVLSVANPRQPVSVSAFAPYLYAVGVNDGGGTEASLLEVRPII